jgi:hypothetical protein
MKGILALLGGLGAGAAIMYLYDPNGGRRRRALIRDKAVGVSNDLRQGIESRGRDLGNRAKGLIHEAKAIMPGTGSNTAEQADQPI